MAPNMAQKRAAKANRRKAMLAERRKAEIVESSLPGRVKRAAAGPIRHCLLQQEALSHNGMGMLIVARQMAPGQLAMAAFLLDTFSLGIKDAFIRPVGEQEFAAYVERLAMSSPFTEVEPVYGRKLLRELATWSRSLGFAPHRDFAAIERVFGDISAEASDAVFRFGQDGKPFYIQGPFDTPAQVEGIAARLERHGDAEALPAPQAE
jgi:hypothetical protein